MTTTNTQQQQGQETNLPTMNNVATVIGTVKNIDATHGSKDGKATISLVLTVTSNIKDQIHENKIRFFAKEDSKLYKSYTTIAKEYKSETEHGEGNGDRISITGNYQNNRFTTKTGEYVENMTIRGFLANRVNAETADQVGLIAECSLVGMVDEISEEGIPTGNLKIRLLNVGYNNSITDIQDVIVDKGLAQMFKQYYKVGCTAEFYFNVNNCVIKEENPQAQQQQAGAFFGQQLDTMPDTTITKYTKSVELIGGQPPKIEGALTPEQIKQALDLNEKAIQKAKTVVANTPPTQPAAFGTNPYSGAQMPVGNDDIPF